MGIKFQCPSCGHKLNVKSFLAGKRGICPDCSEKFWIPQASGGIAQSASQSAAKPSAAGPVPSSPTTNGPTHQPSATVSTAPAAPATHAASSVATQPAAVAPVQQEAAPNLSASPVAAPVQAPVQATTPSVAQNDPLAENPNAVWYVRPRSGGQYGPAMSDVMRQWLGEGRVAADSLVWCEGWPDWRGASDVFPQLGAGAATFTAAASQPTAAVSVASVPEATDLGIPAVSTPAPRSSGGSSRRKSGNLTALFVILLVFVAIALAAVFIYVLTQQNESSGDYDARRPAPAVQMLDATDLPAYDLGSRI